MLLISRAKRLKSTADFICDSFFAKFALNSKMLNFAFKMIKIHTKKATQSHLLFVVDEFLSNKMKI